MILRRITKHVKDQNWTAVALDFAIVVVGVYIGIQLGNWNETRADRRAYLDAMHRLAEESAETLRDGEEQRAIVTAMLADVQTAIEILENCDIGNEAEAVVNQALTTIRSGRGIGAGTLALDQLVEKERLLNVQGIEQQTALRTYHTTLHGLNDVALFVLTEHSARDDHRLIGFTGIVDPNETFNKVDIRLPRVAKPLAEACKDQTFLKLFYRWERGHVFQLHLIGRIEETVREHTRLLNLDVYNTPAEATP